MPTHARREAILEAGRPKAWQQESTLLRLGIAAARADHMADARQFFWQILQKNPRHKAAWMWMGGVVETDAERAHCLRQALMIDADSLVARRALERVQARMENASRLHALVPPAQRICPVCGTANHKDSKFCNDCGARLARDRPPSTPLSPRRAPSLATPEPEPALEDPGPAATQPGVTWRPDSSRVLLTVIFGLLLLMLVFACSLGACVICRGWP